MSTTIPLKVSSNAREFAANLTKYAQTSSKGFSGALASQGPKFSMELFHQFREIRPAKGSIFSSAQTRGFRVSRRSSTTLVPLEGNLSQRAVERARSLLGGQKSDYFRLFNGGLIPVRFGARGSHRILQGGKTGWRFSQSALSAHQLTSSQLRASLNEPVKYGDGTNTIPREQAIGAVRLNLRALATYLELRYRTRGAQGGTMAVQWLNKTYKASQYGTYKTTKLVQRSATGIPIGTIEFEGRGEELTTIVFTGFVPGTPEQADKRGVLDKVFAARAADLLVAIANAQAKAARQHHLN